MKSRWGFLVLAMLPVLGCRPAEVKQYTLSCVAVPSEGGTIVCTPSQAHYAAGEIVELRVELNAEWEFGYWDGDLSGSDNPSSLTMDADKEVVAHLVAFNELAPKILSFTAVPSQIKAGESSTLSWSVNSATAISIDQGIGSVPSDGSVVVSPAADTDYTLTASNAYGTASQVASISMLDSEGPTGSISINGGATHTTSTDVTLSLSATDPSGVSEMEITDGTTSLVCSYATNKQWTLTGEDDIKIVTARFKDTLGNWGSSCSDAIILDTHGPTGSVVINGGAAYAVSSSVTLTLTANDAAGINTMRISNDGGMWYYYGYETTKAFWTAGGGSDAQDGTKTIYVQFEDKLGNWGPVCTDTIFLDRWSKIKVTFNNIKALAAGDDGGIFGDNVLELYWLLMVQDNVLDSVAWTDFVSVALNATRYNIKSMTIERVNGSSDEGNFHINWHVWEYEGVAGVGDDDFGDVHSDYKYDTGTRGWYSLQGTPIPAEMGSADGAKISVSWTIERIDALQ